MEINYDAWYGKYATNDEAGTKDAKTDDGGTRNFERPRICGVAPDDMVKATFTGDKKLKDLTINPEAVDPDDVDMLQDLVLAAVNDGLSKIDNATQQTMGKYTKGVPGM